MNNDIEMIYGMLKLQFQGETLLSHTEIVEKAESLFRFILKDKYTIEMVEKVVSRYEENIAIKAFDPYTIKRNNIDTKWFEEKKSEKIRKHDYWDRYKDYLRNKDFDEDTINVLKNSTEKILGYCANPTPLDGETDVKRKGLVVGDVQSGKTANYMALINMACDYDYKLIVVLAGLTDSLRKQTQERVDEGFIGAVSNTINSEKIKYVGVGGFFHKHYAVPLTDIDNDFKKEKQESVTSTSSDYNKPVILVVKKNKKTLENVKTWLKPGHNGVTDHILIIDDEADNASVNTKKGDEDPSVINALIRDLYNNFPIASYVGYTATPYANIYINPFNENKYDDLFPSDFITLLETPTSYFGATKVFGKSNDGLTKHLRVLVENERLFLPVNHKKDDPYYGIPDSLKEAILTFFINNTIRTKRGATYSHRSMMINISRFNAMQYKIKDKINEYIESLKNIISQTSYMNKEKFLRNKEMLKMYNLFMSDKYYDEIRKEITWEEIQNLLEYEASRMKIILVNRLKDEEKLDYKSYENDGARYIVIGGFVLSRGLTLEGLMVSYYSRNGSAYDTLLQMCRWFGYRRKYEDLCRVYMSQININAFTAVIDATFDLKKQFIDMSRVGKTPMEYGLMVKTCPDIMETLLVTSRNKSRSAVDKIITLNFSKVAVDTSKLYWNPTINNKHHDIIQSELSDKLGKLKNINNRFMYTSVDKSVIAGILRKINIPIENRKFDAISLADYIETSDRFPTWEIAIATGIDKKDSDLKWSFGGHTLPKVNRRFDIRKDENGNFEKIVRISGNNNRLIDPGIFNSGMDDSQLNAVKRKSEGKTPTTEDYLFFRKNPLFVIYPIDLDVGSDEDTILKSEIKKEIGDKVLLGFALGFPLNGEGISIKYKLNIIKQQELERERNNMEDDDDEEV